MSISQTPDAADVNAVTGQAVAATDELGRADMKKAQRRTMSPGLHAATWIAFGFFLAMAIISAWPLILLLINGGNAPLEG